MWIDSFGIHFLFCNALQGGKKVSCFLSSGRRSSSGQHRCVTHLYRIPMWNFDCVIDFAVLVLISSLLINFCIAFDCLQYFEWCKRKKLLRFICCFQTPMKVAQWYVVHECDATMMPWKSTVRTTLVFIFSQQNKKRKPILILNHPKSLRRGGG